MTWQILHDLRLAERIVLSTHRHCDGDGLGAEIALALGLRQLGKRVRLVHVDAVAKKYAFLAPTRDVEVFTPGLFGDEKFDLGVVLDTNDRRLVEPLFTDLESRCKQILFIDHHPELSDAPKASAHSLIDVSAASTGQLCYRLLKALEVRLDREIARALYTSIAFDTQLFRYVKADPASHLIAAELLTLDIDPEGIHRRLFSGYTVGKMRALQKTLGAAEYFADDRAAFIPMRADLFRAAAGDFERDDSGDVVDQVMNVESVEIAALLREDGPHTFKLSLRSKGRLEVLSLAESFGGGGHRFASGARLEGPFDQLRARVIESVLNLIRAGGRQP